jgi:hypothetical protein
LNQRFKVFLGQQLDKKAKGKTKFPTFDFSFMSFLTSVPVTGTVHVPVVVIYPGSQAAGTAKSTDGFQQQQAWWRFHEASKARADDVDEEDEDEAEADKEGDDTDGEQWPADAEPEDEDEERDGDADGFD